MRVKLIVPRWHEQSIWSFFSFRFPYLGVTTLAALTPAHVDVSITDENVEPIRFDSDVDLVGISILTPLACRGYEIADRYRKMGVKVVMGGFHASALPVEAAQHADAVVIGEAEPVWRDLLNDLGRGEIKPTYRATTHPALDGMPVPRRELLNRIGYFFINTMETTRGCPFDCDFCNVTTFYGRSYRCRSLSSIAADLESMRGNADFVFFVDDNIIGDREHAHRLFAHLRGRGIKWLSHASANIAEDRGLVTGAGQSGCCGLFVGFETLNQEGLAELNKRQNRVAKYAEVIGVLHDVGIGVLGSFIFGYDWDGPETFDEVLAFVERTKLDGALFTILTPYPGTRVYARLEAERRIISTDWRRYDMAHAVFRPKRMSPDELEASYLRLNRRFYSCGSMLRRLFAWRRSLQVFGPMNWGFRGSWKRFSYS